MLILWVSQIYLLGWCYVVKEYLLPAKWWMYWLTELLSRRSWYYIKL